MADLLDIGPELIAARRAKRVSQRGLADLVGVKQQQVARWESGAYRSASLERIAAVARALGVSDALVHAQPFAAEAVAKYRASPAVAPATSRPVSDLGEIAARIRARGDEFRALGVSRIGVFGSFALGEQTTASDVDLLVEFASRPAGLAYMAPPELAESVLGRRVDWIEARLLRPELSDRVEREVVYVWDA